VTELEVCRLKPQSGFLPCFTSHGVDDSFVAVEMACHYAVLTISPASLKAPKEQHLTLLFTHQH